MDNDLIRELTKAESKEIRELVNRHCANYDRTVKECLPLESPCYMLGKTSTGAFCRHFEQAVMPLAPGLVELLAGRAAGARECPICGQPFYGDGRRVYCSPRCRNKAKRDRSRAWMRSARNKG